MSTIIPQTTVPPITIPPTPSDGETNLDLLADQHLSHEYLSDAGSTSDESNRGSNRGSVSARPRKPCVLSAIESRKMNAEATRHTRVLTQKVKITPTHYKTQAILLKLARVDVTHKEKELILDQR